MVPQYLMMPHTLLAPVSFPALQHIWRRLQQCVLEGVYLCKRRDGTGTCGSEDREGLRYPSSVWTAISALWIQSGMPTP